MIPFSLGAALNNISTNMAKAKSTRFANDVPNPVIDPKDSSKSQIADSEHKLPPAGPHPPSPPESPKVHKISLSGPRSTSRTADLPTADGAASSTGATGAPTHATAVFTDRDPTATAVSDLLETMKNTLGALGKTFDVLGKQTLQVASLGPAVGALNQIEETQGELDEQKKRQEDRVRQEGEKLREDVKAHIREHLRPHVNEIVSACVRKQIGDRVRHQLTVQIPAELREELLRYRLQIAEAKRSLSNSEARRHNALIRSSGLDEPLKPLLRPLHLSMGPDADSDPDADPDLAQASEKKNKEHNKSNAKDKDKDKGVRTRTDIPTPPSSAASIASVASSRTARPGVGAASRLSVNTSISARTSLAVTAFEASPTSAIGVGVGGLDMGLGGGGWSVVQPVASRNFPRDLAQLISLGADKARALVREYGLVREDEEQGEMVESTGPNARPGRGGRQGGSVGGEKGAGRGGKTQRPMSTATACSDASSWANAGLEGTREDDLNKFMRYIGVGFQVLPSSPVAVGGGGGGVTIQSPVVERRDCAFIR